MNEIVRQTELFAQTEQMTRVIAKRREREVEAIREWEYRRLHQLGPLSQADGKLSFFRPDSAAGVPVDERSMLGLSAIFSAARNLSEDVAKLPLITYKRTEQGRDRYTAHPAYRLLHTSPNEEMTAIAMRQAVTASALLYGRGFIEIEWGRNGKPLALWPLPPWCTKLVRGANKKLYVDYDGKQTLALSDVIYLNGFTLDGVFGEIIAQHGSDSIGLGLASQHFAATFFGNGASPGLVLVHPGKLTAEGEQGALDRWNKQHKGPRKAHSTAILAEGIRVEKVGFNAQEAQQVESRQFAVEDVARWFRMPPHKIGHLLRATGWSTLEATNTDYVIDTLMPWFVRWEQEASRKLFTSDDVFCEHLVDGMLRGDSAGRAALYKSLRDVGAINGNEIRERENMNKIGEDGDKYFISANLRPIDEPFTKPTEPAKPDPDNPEPEDPNNEN